VVDVEREAHGDASSRGVRQRAGDEPRGGLLQVEVVEGEIEGLLGSGDEVPGVFGDLEGGLTPVGQRANLDRQA
jgi:hypothetical protein